MKISAKQSGPFAFTYTIIVKNRKIIGWFQENSREGGEIKLRNGESAESKVAEIYRSVPYDRAVKFLIDVVDNTDLKYDKIKYFINNKIYSDIIQLNKDLRLKTKQIELKISKLQNEIL